MCVDLTGVSPLVGFSSRGFTAGQAAFKAALCKVTKHEKACIENQHVFIPFAFDTFSFLAPEAVELLSRVQRFMHSNVMTPRSTDVVFKRIGFTIQKGLAAQLVARLPSTTIQEKKETAPKVGLEAVLESGHWMIRNTPIILKKWSMSTSLLKEELTRIPIWVKLHDVPLQVFKEDDISLIATFIGKPIMLDSYTSSMCKDSWGRSSFAWCLIKVKSEADLVDSVTIGIPSLTGDDFTKETIRVEKLPKLKINY
ncbi:zinc knuckle CX2CX4HX4C containing protein [Tanacetum coccineum]